MLHWLPVQAVHDMNHRESGSHHVEQRLAVLAMHELLPDGLPVCSCHTWLGQPLQCFAILLNEQLPFSALGLVEVTCRGGLDTAPAGCCGSHCCRV